MEYELRRNEERTVTEDTSFLSSLIGVTSRDTLQNERTMNRLQTANLETEF
jgi:hypothetical protein